jgi:hypothetical protein
MSVMSCRVIAAKNISSAEFISLFKSVVFHLMYMILQIKAFKKS